MAASIGEEVQKGSRRRNSLVVSQPWLSAELINVLQRREGAMARTDGLVLCISIFQRRSVEIEGDAKSVSQPIKTVIE